MKQIVSNYSYSPATNVVTLTGVNIDADQLLLIVAPQVGRTLYNFASVTGVVSAGADTRVTLNASTAGLTTTSPLVIFYDDQGSTQTVAGTVTANVAAVDQFALQGALEQYASNYADGWPVKYSDGATFPISGTVTASLADQLYDSGTPVFVAAYMDSPGGAVIPVSQDANFGMPISGTVTANAFGYDVPNGTIAQIPVHNYDEGFAAGNKAIPVLIGNENGGFNSSYPLPISGTVTVGNSVTIGSLPAISGTVTANLFGEAVGGGPNEPTKLQCDSNGFLITSLYRSGSDAVNYDPVAGNVSVNVKNVSSVTIGSVPNGSLTTRFGTPTTANTAFATSAVTNANRKYLLIQNVTTGSNVITVGIGFTPTTTQGIQLTAGAGITFESSYIPTGAVQILSSVTASNFTILEA